MLEDGLEVAEYGIAHRPLQARTDDWRCCKALEDSAKDHESDLPVVARFGAREGGQLAAEAGGDEIDKDLAKGLLLFTSGGGKRRVHREGMELWMFSIEGYADVEQFPNGFSEGQDAIGVDGLFCFSHFARIIRGQGAGDGFLIRKKLIESGRRHACFRGDGVGGSLVIAEAAEDRSCCTEQILLLLLATRVAFTVGIEDRHTVILAERK